MSPPDSDDNRFEPALLLLLVLVLFIALKRDVFYDVLSQAAAMLALALLVVALLLPVRGLLEMIVSKNRWRNSVRRSLVSPPKANEAAGATASEPPVLVREVEPVPQPAVRALAERNDCAAGGRVLQPVPAHNGNQARLSISISEGRPF